MASLKTADIRNMSVEERNQKLKEPPGPSAP